MLIWLAVSETLQGVKNKGSLSRRPRVKERNEVVQNAYHLLKFTAGSCLEMRVTKRKLFTFEDQRLSVQNSLKKPQTPTVNFSARSTRNSVL